jgi:hypothetical protein
MSSAPQPRSVRSRIELASRGMLTRLHKLPRLLVPAGTVLLIAIGAFAPLPLALVAFVVLFVFIAWVGYLSWPVVTLSGRLMRIAMLVLVVVLATLRSQT